MFGLIWQKYLTQYATHFATIQNLFNRFKEKAIFNGVTSEDIKESLQATIRYASIYFSTNIANPMNFWSKVLNLKKDDQLMKPSLLIADVCLCAPFSSATLDRLFNQMILVKTMWETGIVMIVWTHY